MPRRPINPRILVNQFREAKQNVLYTESRFQRGAYQIRSSERQLERVYLRLMSLNTKLETIRKYRHNLHLQKRLTRI